MATEEKWICTICGNANPIDEVICDNCGSLKEEPAYDAIADLED